MASSLDMSRLPKNPERVLSCNCDINPNETQELSRLDALLRYTHVERLCRA